MTDTKPVPPRAADALIRRFEEMINSGDLRDGQPLPPEREIVQTYGVSRTVAREAVLALSNRGLVQARPRYRPVVRKPSFDTAMDTIGSVVGRLLREPGGVWNLFEARIMTEAALVRHAAQAATPEDLERLHAALDANAAVVEDTAAFLRTDTAFHAVLYDIPGNPLLPAIHRAYVTWLEPQWSRMPPLTKRNRDNLADHAAICAAISAADADAAEAALRSHLSAAWQQVRDAFEGDDSTGAER